MRFALAIAVVAVAGSTALFVDHRRVTVTTFRGCAHSLRQGAPCPSYAVIEDRQSDVEPAWEDPVAILLAIGGVAAAVGIVLTGDYASPSQLWKT